MVPSDRVLVTSYRLFISSVSSAVVLPQFSMESSGRISEMVRDKAKFNIDH